MNRYDDRHLLEAVRDAGLMARRCALATVIETRGSTPRKTGTKMLIDPVAGLVGTVGGGCGEAEVIEAAGQVLRTGMPRMVLVDLTRDLMSWSPAVCGGVMRVLVEPVELAAFDPPAHATEAADGRTRGMGGAEDSSHTVPPTP